ncbi:hypothetical protein [Paenibacillus sp. GbtcB18]|uniref:hypothetical protein n=1 Tax=Paenibacillus sp. GbtcB18 TaxID=2824763 RepID=UPI001C2F791A|nr:hypothetical protein [Paenibacillus sp. GbtcB18]
MKTGKKLSLFVFLFAVMLYSVMASSSVYAAASKYRGGLLDSVTLQTGTTVGQSSGAGVTVLTDDNPSNYISMTKPVWYSFSTPQQINSVIVKSDARAVVDFYDENLNLLDSYTTVTNDGVETLPSPIKDVSTVVLRQGAFAYEWNVFTTPSAAPLPTTITWIQAGDKSVDMDWSSTGAKFYNVKRSTTAGGPYAVLASNISGTSYTDTTVTNKTTYYYVVTAVNEAGESAPSPEKAIKPDATKYTGGLLDRIPLKMGPSTNNPTSTVRLLTDNNPSNYIQTNNTLVWHNFTTPQEISAVIVKSDSRGTIEFYDSSQTLLDSYTPVTNDGVESLPKPIKNVSSVVLKKGGFVYEWNVFGKPTTPPLATTITWIQAGDKTVDLDWTSTGAKFYNVKRSTSPGGPYALLATNVTTASYTDTKVTNNTIYYYVVTAVNEAGESAPSPERSIKPTATKYTGGLLDRVALNMGASTATSTSTTRLLTDNDGANYVFTGTSVVWHTFSSPKIVEAVIVKADAKATIEFYDADNNLLSSYSPVVNDTVETLPAPVQNVTTVVLKQGKYVYEWNVFGKAVEPPVAAPLNLTAAGGDKKITLAWNSVNNATSYNVKRSTTAGGPYVTVGSVTGATYTYTDTNVVNGTTYYYVVTAVAPAGESAPSNEASATPKAGDVVIPPVEESGNSAILVITLNNGTEKEYDLSMNEVNAFIAWYEGRAAGKGPVMFAIDKHENNKGPFKNRKDYILYDKIITFEVNAYDNGKSGNGGTTPPVNPEDPSNY